MAGIEASFPLDPCIRGAALMGDHVIEFSIIGTLRA
jgi:hypothetical protein